MATFFSGTDTATLREEGNDRNHFVSLIVNNAGTYTAAITRKLSIKRVISSTYTYRTFDDIEKEGMRTSEVREEVIAYNYLDIIKEGEVIEPFQEIDQRLEAIRIAKAKPAPTKAPLSTSTYKSNILPYIPPVYIANNNEEKLTYQPSLFDEEYMESEPPRVVPKETSKSDITIPASLVKSISLQLITGSIAIADVSRIDPNKWAEQMVKLFDKRFENDLTLFGLWAELMVEFVVTNFVPGEYAKLEDEYISELCQAVYMTLDKLPKNKYIKAIQDALFLWMK